MLTWATMTYTKAAFSTTITVPISRAEYVVKRRLTNCPMRFFLAVNTIKGIMGNAIIRLRSTWLYTNKDKGSKPKSTAVVVGKTLTTLVIILRRVLFTFVPSMPSMIAIPARVPVVEEAKPEHNSVTAKTIAASDPKIGIIMRYASSTADTLLNFG